MDEAIRSARSWIGSNRIRAPRLYPPVRASNDLENGPTLMQENNIDSPMSSGEESRKPLNHSARRINRLARELAAQNYLEIGVSGGTTLFAVDVPNKSAVDPIFRFSVPEASQKYGNISFNETTSDLFFSSLPPRVKYDLVFVDGLHTFEQTYRDICNVLLHAHDRTVLLIDDVKPNDVFSALRDVNMAQKRRRQNGGTGNDWHGDVFKVLFALHDFHPGLNYRTIVGTGNPQALVWRSNLGWRKPLFDSLEVISRVTYFDMLDHIDILRECSEEKAMELCFKELSSQHRPDAS